MGCHQFECPPTHHNVTQLWCALQHLRQHTTVTCSTHTTSTVTSDWWRPTTVQPYHRPSQASQRQAGMLVVGNVLYNEIGSTFNWELLTGYLGYLRYVFLFFLFGTFDWDLLNFYLDICLGFNDSFITRETRTLLLLFYYYCSLPHSIHTCPSSSFYILLIS